MYTYYRGTPFQFAGQMQDDGVVQDLTNATVQATCFDPTGTVVHGVLTCAVIGDPKQGLVSVSYPDTTAWPVGKARVDFLLFMPNNNGQPIASDPAYFRIAQSPMLP